MPKIDITTLNDDAKVKLVNNRWASSAELWETVEKVYKTNTNIYSNKGDWLKNVPQARKKSVVQANRIFVNMEAVINSLIANPPGINILPGRDGDVSQDFARKMESFLRKKYTDRNMKEVLRMALRNLYFGRIAIIKPFWNPKINDFDIRSVDPLKVRFGKFARNEEESEFAIEEISDNLCAIIARFPDKKKELMKKYSITGDEQLYIKNPDVTYKEAWIDDYVIFTLGNLVLGSIKNPYWDWDGILVTKEEEEEIPKLEGDARRQKLQSIKMDQDNRKQQYEKQKEIGTPVEERAYYYNHFDHPRKPYIFATIFNNENSPIGRTDMITLSAELQKGIDKRKMDIDENCELANGIVMVDSAVMGKSDAQRIRWETRGIIWGQGVAKGVTRLTGSNLPQMVFDDMLDSRAEIDNIMAASSAFRGEREGQETKAGRLALIQQSYLRLNELVQVVDYMMAEVYNWGMQLAKSRYTERHYAKWMGKEGAREVIEIIQDDFEDGIEIDVIAGKTLPIDDEFKFEQAQNDVAAGYISPVDYLEIANYDNAKDLSKRAVLYKQNPMEAVGINEQEMPLPYEPGTPTPDQIASISPEGQPPETPLEVME